MCENVNSRLEDHVHFFVESPPMGQAIHVRKFGCDGIAVENRVKSFQAACDFLEFNAYHCAERIRNTHQQRDNVLLLITDLSISQNCTRPGRISAQHRRSNLSEISDDLLTICPSRHRLYDRPWWYQARGRAASTAGFKPPRRSVDMNQWRRNISN